MNKKPVIVIFGAGNIGRGFIGQLFSQGGYDVVLIDAVESLVSLLNQAGEYPLQLVSNDSDQTIMIGPVSARSIKQQQDVNEAILNADIMATAVGVPILPLLAGPLAEALRYRQDQGRVEPLDILVCENKLGAGDYLKKLIGDAGPGLGDMLENRIGFVETSIGRMVPVLSEAERKANPLLIRSEPYSELPVDAAGFKNKIPAIDNIKPFEPFHFYHQRKLFIHNMGHALTAYLGYLSGYKTIDQAIIRPGIRQLVENAMRQVGAALSRAYNVDFALLEDHILDLLNRFGNRKLGDTVDRVGRDPLRKLSEEDRLAGALKFAVEQGYEPFGIAAGFAAAICFDAKDDPTAETVAAMIGQAGIDGFLQEHSGLTGSVEFDRWRKIICSQIEIIHAIRPLNNEI
jgi:mannitol-1-phosphate 5-dehydrogenase